MKFKNKRYIAQTTDPLHVGSGGERLGRVDMPVARDPVSRAPKIPGTALSGALKFFADWSLRDAGVKTNSCASIMGSDRENPHDHTRCPICSVFGFTGEEDPDSSSSVGKQPTLSMQGTVRFSDAALLAFPLSSYLGAIWVTTPDRLLQAGADVAVDTSQDSFILPDTNDLEINLLDGRLNLGWILLEKAAETLPLQSLMGAGIEEAIAKRTVVVSEWLFGNLANDNLERRTSVVINPETGAAKTGGLFTLEAVPRGSLFIFDLVLHEYGKLSWNTVVWAAEGATKPMDSLEMIEAHAFPGIASVGMGGMTTRGFGRLKINPIEVQEVS